jgi:hypothetical protein
VSLADWGATEWAAAGAVSAVIVYIVLGLIAWIQLREAKRLRAEQTRPFVVVDLVPEHSAGIYLEISNIGRTMARDVTFKFTPTLVSSADQITDDLKNSVIMREGFAFMPPGRCVRYFFDVYFSRGEKNLPMRYEVKVSYRSGVDRQHRWWNRSDRTPRYCETYPIDLAAYEESQGQHSVLSTLGALQEEIKKIREETKRIREVLANRSKFRLRSHGHDVTWIRWRARKDAALPVNV